MKNNSKKRQSAKTICFTVANFWPCLFKQCCLRNLYFQGKNENSLRDRVAAGEFDSERFVSVSVYLLFEFSIRTL